MSVDKSLISATCFSTLVQRGKEGEGGAVRCGGWVSQGDQLWCFLCSTGAEAEAVVFRLSNTLFSFMVIQIAPAGKSQTDSVEKPTPRVDSCNSCGVSSNKTLRGEDLTLVIAASSPSRYEWSGFSLQLADALYYTVSARHFSWLQIYLTDCR